MAMTKAKKASGVNNRNDNAKNNNTKGGRKTKQPQPETELDPDEDELEVISTTAIDAQQQQPSENQSIINDVSATSEVNEINDDNNDDGSIKTKRRGRKPKDKFKYETADIDEYSRNNKKDDNVIVKLPLSCLKLNEEFNIGKDLFPYNPVITTPKPYNPEDLKGGGIGYSLLNNNADADIDADANDDVNEYNPDASGVGSNLSMDRSTSNGINASVKCQNCQCHRMPIHIPIATEFGSGNEKDEKSKDTRQIDIILNNKYYTNTDKFNVLTHLGGCLNGDKWPEKTDIPCLWDCHQFKTTPWGVPYKLTNGKFQLFGNFCSANCVLSYILHFYADDDALWEKVALLNLLYFKVYKEYKSIVPAFDKMGLKMFGGTLEIDEYRNLTGANDKAYGVEFPPCNTIIPMLEEIYKKTNLNNTFIPVDKSRIQAANNELKLKRSKPVVNHKNTLDFCLGKA
jgi:hypothetical protein